MRRCTRGAVEPPQPRCRQKCAYLTALIIFVVFQVEINHLIGTSGTQGKGYRAICKNNNAAAVDVFVKHFRREQTFLKEQQAYRVLGSAAVLCRISVPLLSNPLAMALVFPLALGDLVQFINARGRGLGGGIAGALLVSDLAAAVSYCHARGLAHRDIKPDNVLVSRTGEFMLTDFGHAISANVVDTSIRGGTEQYEAPECLVPGRMRRVVEMDIYAMGRTLTLGIGWPSTELGEGPIQDLVRKCASEDVRERPAAADVWDAALHIVQWSAADVFCARQELTR